jgi:hypothetical protein
MLLCYGTYGSDLAIRCDGYPPAGRILVQIDDLCHRAPAAGHLRARHPSRGKHPIIWCIWCIWLNNTTLATLKPTIGIIGLYSNGDIHPSWCRCKKSANKRRKVSVQHYSPSRPAGNENTFAPRSVPNGRSIGSIQHQQPSHAVK